MTQSSRFILSPEAEQDLRRLGLLVEKRLGLVFSEKRARDLWQAMLSLAALAQRSPTELMHKWANEGLSEAATTALAEYLTIGETYFFREPKTLRAFEELVLKRFTSGKKPERFRIWCAGCSTGEEAYTLSIILHRLLPDIRSMDVSILGTDINPRVLEKARRGAYSSWSFRGLEKSLKERFFEPLDDGSWSVKHLFRQRVSFSLLNLADDEWRLWDNGSHPDVLFCRNVLIYFSADQRKNVVFRFHSLLPPEGWLVVAPCESSALLASKFTPVHHDGATLYKKQAVPEPTERDVSFPEPLFSALPVGAMLDEAPMEEEPAETGFPYEESPFLAAETFLETVPEDQEDEEPGEALSESVGACLQNARILADKGRHDEALQWALKAKDLDRTAPEPLYLAALISSETGDEREAAASLRSALFLAPDFVMAHYALASLAMKSGRDADSERHLRNAEALLSSLPPDAPLREGDGLCAGDLLQTVRGLRRNSIFE